MGENITYNSHMYSAGLPCYISKGNTLYIGGTWKAAIYLYGEVDTTSNKNYVKVYLPLVNSGGWAVYVRSKNTIPTSNFTKAVVNGHKSNTYGQDICFSYCSFGVDNAYGQLTNECGVYFDSTTDKDYTITLKANMNYYFGVTISTFGSELTSYLNYAYLY